MHIGIIPFRMTPALFRFIVLLITFSDTGLAEKYVGGRGVL